MQQMKEKYQSIMDPVMNLPNKVQDTISSIQRRRLVIQRAKLKIKDAERALFTAKQRHSKIKSVQSFDNVERCKANVKAAKKELKFLEDEKKNNRKLNSRK